MADRLDIDIGKIRADSNLVNELGLDSFMAVELAFELKQKLGVEILVNEFQQIATVKDIVNFISSKIVTGGQKNEK